MPPKQAMCVLIVSLTTSNVLGIDPTQLCSVTDGEVMSFSEGNPAWNANEFNFDYNGGFISWFTDCSSGTTSVCQSCYKMELWQKISSEPEHWVHLNPASPYCDASDLLDCEIGGYAFSQFSLHDLAPDTTYKINVYVGPCANHSGCIEYSMFGGYRIFRTPTMPPGNSSS